MQIRSFIEAVTTCSGYRTGMLEFTGYVRKPDSSENNTRVSILLFYCQELLHDSVHVCTKCSQMSVQYDKNFYFLLFSIFRLR